MAVCEEEPRRVAEGRAEGVAKRVRGVRAGREGVAPAGVACGAGCARVDAGLVLIGTPCVANVDLNGHRNVNNRLDCILLTCGCSHVIRRECGW